MSVSMRSIAREVGVSPSVVSQLLRGDPSLRISEARRRAIFEARDRLGGVKVRPSRLSHLIVAPVGNTRSRAYIERSIQDNFTYQAFEKALKDRGYRLEVQPIPETEICGRVRGWIRSRRGPDGIYIQSGYCTPELAELLRTYAFAHVCHDFTREHLEINTVCHHATAGMRQLVEHLAGLGHRRMAFMGPQRFFRYPMMVSAMTALELPVDPQDNAWLEPVAYPDHPAHMRQRAFEAFDGWFEHRRGATALVCSNDHVALGVVDAMRRRGLVPGRDLSVAGYDNLEAEGRKAPDQAVLTTINNPFERIGRRMAELLTNQIEQGQTAIIHERVPVSLVVRSTTGPCPPQLQKEVKS